MKTYFSVSFLQVQFLHCIKQTVTGGDSEIVDGFNVCRKLKEKNPQAFQILSSTFVDFTDIGVDYCDFSVQSKHKIIEYVLFSFLKKFRSSCHGSADMNLTSIHDDTGSIPGLTQWV